MRPPTTAAGRGCALVTGASRGIGAAIARGLAADGWAVGINYLENERAAETVADAIRAEGGEAVTHGVDMRLPGAADELCSRLEHVLGGPVLVLVNNAGVTADGLSFQLRDEDWQSVVELNLSAAFRLTRRVMPGMLRQRFGRIVNVASVVGQRANAGQSNYAASKAGLVGFTKTVAVEVATQPITANVIAPGVIDTDATVGTASSLRAAIPARRAGTPEEVAICARFLASEESSYVTGSVLTVDGGLTA